MRKSMGFLYGATLLIAYCSISYELLLAQYLSVLLGNSIHRFTSTLGIYIFSLGVGAWWAGHLKEGGARHRYLLRIEIALSVLGMGIPFYLFGSEALIRSFCEWKQIPFSSGISTSLIWVVAHGLMVSIGFLSGMEVPLLMDLEKAQGGSTTWVLPLDYLSSFLGAVSFPLVIYLGMGLLSGSAMVGVLNGISAWMLSRVGSEPVPGYTRWGIGLSGLGVLLWVFEGASHGWLMRVFL